ncbi:MAG: carbonic anhydrase [Verrucomicrobia bacterium]|nr:carbonic anhydrase [Verrucomicrobiota bacterium]
MCSQDDHNLENLSPDLARRSFLKLVSAAALGFGFLPRSQAAETKAPPKPQNVLSPNAALHRLMEGNDRYVEGKMKPHDFISERRSLALGQNPFAVILSCSDSRVGPEIVFDQGLGDLFVVRTAGEVVDGAALGSIEYAVEHLGSTLIVVLGHERCGAVSAAVAGSKEPGHIAAVLKAIEPAVKQVKGKPGDPVENAVRAQAVLVARHLQSAEPILVERVRSGQLKIVAGRYDLDTGKVELLSF